MQTITIHPANPESAINSYGVSIANAALIIAGTDTRVLGIANLRTALAFISEGVAEITALIDKAEAVPNPKGN